MLAENLQTPPVDLLADVLCGGCVGADAVSLHLGEQVSLSQPGGRLGAALQAVGG